MHRLKWSREKLIERIKKIPADFTYEELSRLLNDFGYRENHKGRTSGSRVAFYRERDGALIILHKPHPGNILKKYAVRQIVEKLEEKGDL